VLVLVKIYSIYSVSYIYWTVHHLASSIKIDQLDVTCFIISLFNAQHAFLFHYLMLIMFRMLVHPSSGACDLFVALFHGLCFSGSMCVGVTLWFGWGGVVSLCRLKPASGYHTTPTNKSQAPEDGCTNIRNMLSIK